MDKNMSFGRFFSIVLPKVKWSILALIIVNIIYAIDLSLSPYLVKNILDTLETTARAEVVENLMIPAIYFIGWICCAIATYRFYDWVIMNYEPKFRKTICLFFIEHILGHSYKYFQTHFTGNINNRINDAVLATPYIVQMVVDRIVGTLLIISVAIYTLYHVHPVFSLAMTLWATAFFGVILLAAPFAHKRAHDMARVRSGMNGIVVDTLSNMMTVRLFNGRGFTYSKISQRAEETAKAEKKLKSFYLYVMTIQGFAYIIFQAFCLKMLVMDYRDGLVTLGDFALVFGVNLNIVQAVWDLSREISEMTEYWGKITQGLEITMVPHDVKDVSNAKELNITHGNINFKDVTFRFPDGKQMFSNKNLLITGGQKVGLVGYSGSGKSTFAHLILRLFDIQEGEILIDDQNIHSATQESLRQAISFIPQDPGLFHTTIWENIRYGRLDATEEEIIEAAKQAHAHEFVMNLEDGYETVVGERGVKLSGGQRQRIAIARAFLKKAPILILDEATSALDSRTEELIQESLNKLMVGKTTIVIAHRLSTLLTMDRILVFDRGLIIQDGSHQELLQQDGLYRTLWQTQVGGFLPDRR